MANRIRGITIEIGGDTTKLDKALSGTNKNIKDTQSALKDVERLLKMNPKSTELLEQKQRVLANSIENTREKLEKLSEVMKTADEALQRGKDYSAVYDPLKKQLDSVSTALKEAYDEDSKLKKQLENGKIDTEEYEYHKEMLDALKERYADLQKQVEKVNKEFEGTKIDQSQYDAIQRELIETKNDLDEAEKAAERFSSGLDELSQKSGRVSETAGKISNAFSPVTKTIGALGAAAVATVPATEELRSDLSKLDNNARMAGVGIDSAREAFKNFAVVSDETDSSVEAVSNLLQAGFTESNLQKAVENLSAAYLAFPDTMKIESLADSLQETLATGEATGQFAELLDRLGIGAENFSAGLANCTTEAQKQDYALSTLAHSGLSATYEEWVKNNEELVENKEASIELQESLAELAESVQPIVTKVTELATKFLDWFNSLDDGAKNLIITIGALVFAIGPVAGAIQGISKVLPNAVGLLDKMDLKTAGVVGGLVLLVDLALKVADAWKNMSTLEKAISVLGMLAAAAAVLAIALNAVSGPIGIALVVAGLVGGIAAVLLAVNSANSKAKAATGNEYNTYPAYANGGVIPPNDPYLALVGDNKTEREIIAPESTLRQIYREENGSGGGYRPVSVNAIMQVDGVTFGRLMVPYIDDETARRGVSIVNK